MSEDYDFMDELDNIGMVDNEEAASYHEDDDSQFDIKKAIELSESNIKQEEEKKRLNIESFKNKVANINNDRDKDLLNIKQVNLSSEEMNFKNKLLNKFSSDIKLLPGIDGFMNFVATRSKEQRDSMYKTLEIDRIMGNPVMEFHFISTYLAPFQISEQYDLQMEMTKFMGEIQKQSTEEMVRLISILRDELDAVSRAIKTVSESSKKELVFIAHENDKKMQHEKSLAKDDYEKYVAKLTNDHKSFLEQLKSIESSLQKSAEIENTKARNNLYTELPKTIAPLIEKAVAKEFKKLNDRDSFNNFITNLASVVVGIILCAIVYKIIF